jgi:guanosine-3',5'-bis(diphosphate) 3'-pyrophosphohydrolase
MDRQQVIDKVKEYATKAHGDQMRKYTPEPYIVHPVRVMELCAKYTENTAILCAALLHDVLEDTNVTEAELLAFLRTVMSEQEAERTLKLVVDLTDVYIKEKFPKYNRRTRKQMERERVARTSPDAQTVKYADIYDNTTEIVKHDPSFAKVFLHECRLTLRSIRSGNPQLYELAVNAVENGLERVYDKK